MRFFFEPSLERDVGIGMWNPSALLGILCLLLTVALWVTRPGVL